MRSPWKIVLGILTTAVLLWFLLREIQFQHIGAVLSALRPWFISLAAVSYVFCYAARAWRFRILLSRRLPFVPLFGIVSLHNFFTSILPARTGELSYVVLTHNRKIPVSHGLATLLLARLLDFLVVTVVFFVTLPLLPAIPGPLQGALWMIAIFLGIITTGIVAFLCLGERFVILLRVVLEQLRLGRVPIVSRVLGKLQEGVAISAELRTLRNITLLLGSTIFVWIFQYLTYFALVHGMGMDLPLHIVVLAMSFISLASAIPIQGIAGFGVNEGWWTVAYTALGLETTLAISSGFVQLIVILFFYTILGLLGLLILRWPKKR